MGNGVTLIDGIADALDYAYSFAPGRSPESDRIYNILDYGGAGDGELDNSIAYKRLIEDALKEAKPGETILFPAGVYLFANPLNVPTGFELRGIGEGVVHAVSQPLSMLLIEENTTTLEQSFVNLSEDSGIHGFRIVFRRQGISNVIYQEVTPYPATIRGLGRGVWMENCSILNAYDALDFASVRCDDFIVNDVWATALHTFLKVGAGSTGGRVEHVFNTFAVWMETSGLAENRSELESYFMLHSVSVEIGHAKNLQMFSFSSYGAKIGLRFLDGKKTCDDIKIYRALMDNPNSDANVLFEDGTDIKIFGLSSANYDETHVLNSQGFRGSAKIYGYNWWPSLITDPYDEARIDILRYGAAASAAGLKKLCPRERRLDRMQSGSGQKRRSSGGNSSVGCVLEERRHHRRRSFRVFSNGSWQDEKCSENPNFLRPIHSAVHRAGGSHPV